MNAIRIPIQLCLVILLFSACSQSTKNLPLNQGQATIAPNTSEFASTLQIKFLGTTCFYINHGQTAILTDPFLSNPSIFRLLFLPLKSNPKRIAYKLPDLSNTDLVAVGHCHYDHLLDLPYLANQIPQEALICGSNTMLHTLAPFNLPQQQISVNDTSNLLMGNAIHTGQWIYTNDKTLRVMALQSEHPPHIKTIKLFPRRLQKDLSCSPRRITDWQEGQTLAFIFDFLAPNESIQYRIFFQSSVAEFPLGAFPPKLLDEKPIDIAIISAALSDKIPQYPIPLLEYLKPQTIILNHWDNFFKPRHKPTQPISSQDLQSFISRIKEIMPPSTKIILPTIGSNHNFPQ